MPAENFESKLGFDATQALKTLRLLETVVGAYTKSLKSNTTATQQFNTAQQGVDSILDGLAEGAVAARKEIEKLATAQDKAAQSARRQAEAAKTARQLDARRTSLAVGRQVQQFLQVDRSGATVPQLANFDKSIAGLESLVARTGVSQKQVQKILNNLSASYRGVERQIRDSIVRIIQQQARLGGNNLQRANQLLGTLGITGQQAGQQVTTGLQNAQAASQGLLLSWQSVVRIFVGQAIFRAVSRLTSEIGDSVNRARELQLALAEIQTIAPPDLRFGSRQDVSRITQQLSADFGIDQVEAARAVYEAFSNQVGNTAETISFMQTTAQFARATLTDLADAGDLLSGVMNAYGLANENAQRTADILFKTIDLGRVRGEDIANTFGRVAPLAAQLGVEFEELAAALATVTIQGVRPDDALTQLQNIMKGLIKPTVDLRNRLEELGIASAEIGVQRFGLVGFIEQIVEGASSVEDLSKFFDDVRELRGVLSVLSQDGQLFKNTLQEIREESEGAAEAAANLILETPAAQLQKSIEEFKNVITEGIGNEIIDLLINVIDFFGGAEGAARAFTTVVVGGASAAALILGGQLLTSIGSVTASLISMATAGGIALGTLGGLLAFTGIGLLAGGIAAVAIAVSDAEDRIGSLRAELDASKRASDDFAKSAIAAQQRANRVIEEQTSINASALIDTLSDRARATSDLQDQAERAEKAITSNLKNQVQERGRLIERFIRDVEKSIEDASRNIKRITDDTRDFEFRINRDRFERNLRTTEDDPRREAQLLRQRVNELLDAVQRAASIGETDFARTLSDEALAVASRLADLSGFRRQGEAEVNKVLKSRQSLNSSLIAQEQEKAASAEAAKQTLDEQNVAIQDQISQFNSLLKELQKGDLTGKQRTDLQNQIADLAQEIQGNLTDFGAEGLKGFDDQLAQIREGFVSLDGSRISLDFVVDEGLSKVENILNQTRFSATLELEIEELTGIPGGPGQVDALQKRVAQLQEDIERNQDNAVGLTAALNTAEVEAQDIGRALDKLDQETRAIQRGGFFNILAENLDIFGEQKEGAAQRQELAENLKSQLDVLRTQITEAISSGDFDGLLEIQSKISQFLSANTDNQGLVQFNQLLQTLSGEITAFITAQEKIQQTQVAADAALAGREELAKLIELLPGAQQAVETIIQENEELQKAGTASDQGVGRAKSNVDALTSSTRQAIKEQRLLNELLAAQPAGPAQGQATGGPVRFFADGGFAPRGTDTIPAMLSPGEFVVNAASSRRFFSELVSINAGRPPAFRAEGGPITNNTFAGDININLPDGSGLKDGRAAAAAIRREIRRKSSRI